MEVKKSKMPIYGHGILHPGARPMQVLKDERGELWLCDKGVNPALGYLQQGCWRCRDLAFTRND